MTLHFRRIVCCSEGIFNWNTQCDPYLKIQGAYMLDLASMGQAAFCTQYLAVAIHLSPQNCSYIGCIHFSNTFVLCQIVLSVSDMIYQNEIKKKSHIFNVILTQSLSLIICQEICTWLRFVVGVAVHRFVLPKYFRVISQACLSILESKAALGNMTNTSQHPLQTNNVTKTKQGTT